MHGCNQFPEQSQQHIKVQQVIPVSSKYYFVVHPYLRKRSPLYKINYFEGTTKNNINPEVFPHFMLEKFLGYIDILMIIILLLAYFKLVPIFIPILAVLYLIAKAVIFRGNLYSFLDLIMAVCIIFAMFHVIALVVIFLAFLMLNKAYASITHKYIID